MDKTLELVMDSTIEKIPEISALLGEEMQTLGFCSEIILDTQLAVEEAITNIINHGYKKTGGKIIVSSRINPERIEVQIIDTAPRFNPLSVPEPDLDSTIEDRNIGGLGIFLIRQLMDEVSYRYEDGKNILVLTKKRIV
ncbi:MAG TPA: ATP-binding protein [Methanoregula sp.]|nr:ATP-binding protein [Methanoregula sp.]